MLNVATSEMRLKKKKITLQFCLPKIEPPVDILHERQAQVLLVHHGTPGEDLSAWHVAVVTISLNKINAVK